MSEHSIHSSLTESGRAFLQRRVSRFGLMSSIVFGGFFLFRIVMVILQSEHGVPWSKWDSSIQAHGVATLCFVAIWGLCSRGALSAAAVRRIESVGLIAAAIAVNWMGATIPLVGRPDYILLLALGAALTSRAIYVPSSRMRSFVLSTVIGCATVATTYVTYLSIDLEAWSHVQPLLADFTAEQSAMSMALNAAAWWVVTIFTTTAASDVIFGLRRDARNAQRLGQYQLDSKLGEGGMGIVYKAHHALLRRPTAVKLLLPEKAGEHSIERFEREVRLMAKLRHPNTVTVFDYGRSPEGLFYYAMEYIDGATLNDVVSETGPLEPARALGVMSQAASAMVEAHGIGLIHRDIKPANVMLYLPHSYGIEEAVKVLDFGLVKEIASDDASLTKAGSLTGTPQYMAPEAIRNSENVDARSDIYALGCLLFFLLTGEHLFDGESIMEVCGKHLHEIPDTMSSRLGVRVDPQLEELVSACVAKDPADRPQSARELRTALREVEGLGTFTEHDATEWWQEYGALFEREYSPASTMLTVDLAVARRTPSA